MIGFVCNFSSIIRVFKLKPHTISDVLRIYNIKIGTLFNRPRIRRRGYIGKQSIPTMM